MPSSNRSAQRARTTGVALLVLLAGSPVSPAAAQTPAPLVHTVTTTGDAEDVAIGDGVCLTASGACTLRAAITEANASAGADRIEFAIPGAGRQVIAPRSPYQDLRDTTGPTVIDGSTQPGARVLNRSIFTPELTIEVAGPGATSADSFDLLTITSADNVIRGLAVHGFHKQLTIEGPGARRNAVVGNLIGMDGSDVGTQSRETEPTFGANGVTIRGGATDNVIGAPSATDGNIISGNGQHGVAIYGEGTDRNVVRSNIIGIGRGVLRRAANQGSGIVVASGASDNVIGGALTIGDVAPGEGNVVSGNRRHGVQVLHGTGTSGNQVIGNAIGTLPWGGAAEDWRNRGWGVRIEDGVTDNLFSGNLITNNVEGGVVIGGGPKRNRFTRNRIGNTESWGVGNLGPGIRLERGAFGSELVENVINGNAGTGIEVEGENTNNNAFRRNSVYGNGGSGIDLAPLGEVNQPLTPPVPVGPNKQVGAPVIDAASGGAVTGRGCGGCVIELFVTDEEPGGVPQGRVYVGATTVVDGRFSFEVTGLVEGGRVTATATDPVGNTSEYADPLLVDAD